jgi:hypothetical protein
MCLSPGLRSTQQIRLSPARILKKGEAKVGPTVSLPGKNIVTPAAFEFHPKKIYDSSPPHLLQCFLPRGAR